VRLPGAQTLSGFLSQLQIRFCDDLDARALAENRLVVPRKVRMQLSSEIQTREIQVRSNSLRPPLPLRQHAHKPLGSPYWTSAQPKRVT
jgi:hypothetical protein